MKQQYKITIVFALVFIFAIMRGIRLRDKILLNLAFVEPFYLTDEKLGQIGVSPVIDESDPALIWRQGYRLWQTGQPEEAVDVWQQSSQYSAQMLLAHIRAGNDEDYQMLRTALLLDPFSDEVSEVTSFYLLHRDETELAYQLFGDVVQQNPDNGVATAVLALTSPLHPEEQGDIAIKLFDKAITIAPENAYVLRYGLRLMQQRPDFDVSRIHRLIELTKPQLPQDFEITFALANAYRRLNDYVAAERYNLMALEIEENHPWANLQQVELRQQQNNLDVYPWLERAITLRIQSRPDYYKRLISVLIAAHDLETAQSIYCEALQRGYSPELFQDRSDILAMSGDC